ncbi:MAG TPA: DUF5686 and carboxypeptidase regulatory-like domain-containing protein [Bacteroidales bacterium]|nr:DUF5686 and carboxypeptidase regulatory-like domain-containing protein [Bacteroidales bacterium]
MKREFLHTRIIFSVALAIVLSSNLFSQNLKGTIKDTQGAPIPYATVYIRELSQGTTANTRGDYEIRLPDGKYTVIYQSLGYEPDIRNITVAKNVIRIDIVLQVQTYEIPEVRITASGEDPAYGIMRKVIGLAPYYMNQVESYKADVYLKGNLLLRRIPKIIQRQMKVEARNSSGNSTNIVMKEGDTYLMESFNEIEFRAPDKYNQHVISSQSTFPEEGNEISPMDFIRASFYEPVLNGMFISPLSPEAFFHYKFHYAGVSAQGQYYVDKIEVKPKRKSQQLFEGTIYIIEELWCLYSVDLQNDNIAGNIRIQQLFIPVEENVWLPVSDKFDVNISILGIKGDAGYGSSIKYREVNLNKKLKKPEGLGEFSSGTSTVITSKDTTKTKTTRQIENILSKKELSNHDMVKLSSLFDKQAKEVLPDSVKNNLEVKEKTTYVIEKDAGRKDSSYWAGIRPIPLSADEIKSIRSADSLKGKLNLTEVKKDTLGMPVAKQKKGGSVLSGIALGHTWSDTTGLRFSTSGLLNLRNFSFNTVDGFVYGMDFRLNKTFDKKFRLGIYPTFQYAFSRENFMWKVNGQFGAVNGNRMFYFRTGQTSRDLNGSSGISPLVNTVTTLFLESNYLKLYSAGYLTIGYKTEISNGLSLDIQAGYENRKMLANTTDFTIIKTSKQYTANYPVNEYLSSIPPGSFYDLRDHRHGEILFTVQYTPQQRYMMRGGSRIPQGSDWPTFSFSWKHGVNDFSRFSPNLLSYDQVRVEVFKRKSVGAFSEFRWRFRAGTFLNKTGFSFIDFNHFNSQPFPVMVKDYEDAFMLPRFYSLSTPGMYSELHLKYTTPYLLVKLIPGISKTLMRENLILSSLLTQNHEAYTEIGYSISEVLLIGELGVYAGFRNLGYNSAGIKLVLRLN